MNKHESKEWKWEEIAHKPDATLDEKVIDNMVNSVGLSRSQAREQLKQYKKEPKKLYQNSYYKVTMRDVPWADGFILRHLSVTHTDGGTGRDWRDYQQIKNDLIGKECEAVELYPADSRLVDSADSFHLWGVTDEKFRFPVGFDDRLVSDCEREAGTQRKL
jgi:hypothetical protein